ncbi:MAG: ribonuclease HI [Pseudomonadota bacterium]
MKEIIIYTDGACSGNPGPGGWAALLMYNNHRKTISGGDPHTTNNRMEMLAAIEALKLVHLPCNIKLYTDSKYLQEGVTSWMPKWKANNWHRGKNPVKNIDLWKTLDLEVSKHKIEFIWVKAHNNNPFNELVDELARSESQKIR